MVPSGFAAKIQAVISSVPKTRVIYLRKPLTRGILHNNLILNVTSIVNSRKSFFVCSDKAKPCSFWVWGDVRIPSRTACRHGLLCVIREVKKEGPNKGRKFLTIRKTHASTLIGCPKSIIMMPIFYNHSKTNQSKRESNIS